MEKKAPAKRQRIGQIVGAFGIKGQVKVELLTEFIERFSKGRKLWIGDAEYTIEYSTIHKGRPLIKLSGIDTTNQAEALQWTYLDTGNLKRPKLDEDEFLTSDLIGLEVQTVGGELLGQVQDVQIYPAHELLVVGDILIPAVKQFVKDINLQTGRITVELIPGMRPGEEGA